ncbi:alpha/beta fold hydrolase [Falsigemmobacter intermedius]|uniref:Alpha/beta fold hydrolase n=1 Tax=Falsigemmobacter intermedius TaxID=1553448 RepID=A0A444MB76_9RHOB|nr:alpha/beta fold hydrolase [Falsigemmobacter intermedius]RWY40969.1 alpha/beta fold hydrolase [Falsigemmobacter intermedius]
MQTSDFDGFVTTPAARLRVRVQRAAEADRPWVIFSNSLATSHRIWDAQAEMLSGRFNLLRYDQRGHGESPATGAVTIADLGADLAALAEHFDVRNAVGVGLSMGVPTMLAFAGRAPERLRALVLTDGQAATQPGGAAMWEKRVARARERGMDWVAEDIITRWFQPENRTLPGVKALEASIRTLSLEGYAACATALQGYDFASVAAGFDKPVLLVAGALDGAMPDVMARMEGIFPKARLQIIPGAGHIPNLEQTQAYNAALSDFIDSLD